MVVYVASAAGLLLAGLVVFDILMVAFAETIYEPFISFVRDSFSPNIAVIAIGFAIIAAIIIFISEVDFHTFLGILANAITAVAIAFAGFYLAENVSVNVSGGSLKLLAEGWMPALLCSVGVAVVGVACRYLFRTEAPARLAVLGILFILTTMFLKSSFAPNIGFLPSAGVFEQNIKIGFHLAKYGFVSFVFCLPGLIVALLANIRFKAEKREQS